MRRKDKLIKYIKFDFSLPGLSFLLFFIPCLIIYTIMGVAFWSLQLERIGAYIAIIHFALGYFIFFFILIALVGSIPSEIKMRKLLGEERIYKEVAAEFEIGASYIDDQLRIGEKYIFVKGSGFYPIDGIEYIDIEESKGKNKISINFGFADGVRVAITGRYNKKYYMEIAEVMQLKNEKIKLLDYGATHIKERSCTTNEEKIPNQIYIFLILAFVFLLVGIFIARELICNLSLFGYEKKPYWWL